MLKHNPFDAWLQAIRQGETCALATVIQEDTSSEQYRPKRMFIQIDKTIGTLEDGRLDEQAIEVARRKLSEKTPTPETLTLLDEQAIERKVFIDLFIPPAEIMIFGAGHDAIPVVKYSVALGFHTTVVDQRTGYNTEENFPNTNRLIVRPENFADEITITKNTYVIVMNHHIEKDRETLKYVLRSKAPYVGLLGPKSRRIKMLDTLREEGVQFTEEELAKMYNPVGLDIGAETSEEIAISILAEIIALRNGHQGGFLKDSHQIHHYSKFEEE